MAELHFETRGDVSVVTIDNPPFNVVTVGLAVALAGLLDKLESDREVRALVLTGAGDRAFCAGSDIKEFSNFIGPGGDVLENKMSAENAAFSKLAEFSKPTVAAVNRHALGGGLELAVCCDLLVADERAKLGLPEVKLGVFPGAGGTARVPRRIGEGRAKELMLLGDPINAQTGLNWGLVNRVAPQGKALEVSLELAAQMADRATGAIALCKSAIAAGRGRAEEDAVQAMLPLLERAFEAPEIQEGVRAFLAKEEPDFRSV